MLGAGVVVAATAAALVGSRLRLIAGDSLFLLFSLAIEVVLFKNYLI